MVSVDTTVKAGYDHDEEGGRGGSSRAQGGSNLGIPRIS
jgi:hypothetical protein